MLSWALFPTASLENYPPYQLQVVRPDAQTLCFLREVRVEKLWIFEFWWENSSELCWTKKNHGRRRLPHYERTWETGPGQKHLMKSELRVSSMRPSYAVGVSVRLPRSQIFSPSRIFSAKKKMINSQFQSLKKNHFRNIPRKLSKGHLAGFISRFPLV